MPGCAAYGCSNSNKKGFYMARFPRDAKRKALWIAAVNRPELRLTSASALCEVHFDEASWEKVRVDGTRKLRCNAVPKKCLPSSGVKRRDNVLKRQMTKNEEPPRMVFILPTIADNPNVVKLENLTNDETVPDENALVLKTEVNGDSLETYNQTHSRHESPSSPPKQKSRISNLVNHDVCNKLLQRSERINKLLKKKLKAVRAENLKLRRNQAIIPKNVFNTDQVDMLERSLKKCSKWSNETVKSALKIKFSVGNKGYQELLGQNIPLPSLRTLSRKIEAIHFDSGVQDDIFNLLATKFASVTNEHERECSLVFDQMKITSGILYDGATKEYIGRISMPGHTGDATHALVFMLAGITVEWRQIVAYHYTGASVQGEFLKPIILDIVEQAENIGLKVSNITCDMSPANQALWSSFGIQACPLNVTNSIDHPAHSDRRLHFLADVSHLLKNIKSALLNNERIYISEEIQARYNLPSNCILSEHFNLDIESQSHAQFSLSPKLNDGDLDTNKECAKTRVKKARNLLSHNAGASSKPISDIREIKELETTAWFVEKMANWFSLMTSCDPGTALSKANMNEYDKAIKNLKEIIVIFGTMQLGEKKCWKPIQTGVIISTSSILQLAEYFLEQGQLPHLLTGRFTQNCVEDLIAVIKSKHTVPSALQFKQNLRIICISQFMENIETRNYEMGDGDFCQRPSSSTIH